MFLIGTKMTISKTKIDGIYIVSPNRIIDDRGYFQVIYSSSELAKQGIKHEIVQINQARTLKKGIVRGIHMQKFPNSESKFIQCTEGSIFDVSVDFRKKSPTFGKWFGVTLSNENNKMIYIPEGIMHGYQTLENNTVVNYSVSQPYTPDKVFGIRWDDPYFKIDWPIKGATVSAVDKKWPLYNM